MLVGHSCRSLSTARFSFLAYLSESCVCVCARWYQVSLMLLSQNTPRQLRGRFPPITIISKWPTLAKTGQDVKREVNFKQVSLSLSRRLLRIVLDNSLLKASVFILWGFFFFFFYSADRALYEPEIWRHHTQTSTKTHLLKLVFSAWVPNLQH